MRPEACYNGENRKGFLSRERILVKTGVIDVGGGFRGIYAAGVLDYCIDQGITFDLGIGVSAGGANLVTFLAGQKGRTYRFYTEYGFRKQYASLQNFFRRHSYIDMEYVYGTLSCTGGEYPLDYPALRANPMDLIVVATDAATGRARFFRKDDLRQDSYDILKATASIPFFCPPYPVGDALYYDGALGDPVPVEKAFELGCDRAVLILTKPENVLRGPKKDERLAAAIRRKYPNSADSLCSRAERYNREVALAQEYAKQGRVLIVAPDDTCGVDTLKRSKDDLDRLYQKGYGDGQKIRDFLNRA